MERETVTGAVGINIAGTEIQSEDCHQSYIIDPHQAVGLVVARRLRNLRTGTRTVFSKLKLRSSILYSFITPLIMARRAAVTLYKRVATVR